MKFIALLCGAAMAFAANAAPTSEQTSLSLLIRQLDQIENTLQRAQEQARQNTSDRFYFDYPQADADIKTIRAGINHYLSPSRAQPRDVTQLSGLYRREDAPHD